MLACAMPAFTAVGIGPRDLHLPLVPANPVITWGKVTSTSPLRISDGRADIEVTGLSDLDQGDYVVVEGNWNGSILAASQEPRKARAYKFPSETEMVRVPAGSFQMGNNGAEPFTCLHYPQECPQHLVDLPAYWIGKHEVTRAEYARFIDAGGYYDPGYWSSDGWSWRVVNSRTKPEYWPAWICFYHGPSGCDPATCSRGFAQTDKHPIVCVTYYEAEAFCNWAGGHLPTEAQWEKAARWTGGYPNVYPWGNTWDDERCNSWTGGPYPVYQTTPVGSYPSGMSPYGCDDMAGNVWEWVRDWYLSYPGSTSPFDDTDVHRVLRGGAWSTFDNHCRCAYRYYLNPAGWDYSGFRLARSGDG